MTVASDFASRVRRGYRAKRKNGLKTVEAIPAGSEAVGLGRRGGSRRWVSGLHARRRVRGK